MINIRLVVCVICDLFDIYEEARGTAARTAVISNTMNDV